MEIILKNKAKFNFSGEMRVGLLQNSPYLLNDPRIYTHVCVNVYWCLHL